MNQKQYHKVNYLKQVIKFSSLTGSKENMFQYCENNSEEHEDAKFEMFKQLIYAGFSVFTEVEFLKDLGRADIVAFTKTGGHIYEIVCSEKLESIKDKINKYPIDYELHFIDSKTLEELEI